jgi:hypothetical protein
MPLLVVGCATQRPVAVQAPPPVLVAAVVPTKLVETRYDVRGYHEAANPAVRHEAHAVYRRTRVPLAASDELATVPRTAYAPASIAPLPASDELAAELTTQKKITGDLRAMQTSMAETEQRMQTQYAMLVRQSAEALKLREQLEAERGRARATPPAAVAAVAVAPADAKAAEVKW